MPQPVGQPVEPASRIGLQHVAVAVEVGDVGDVARFDPVLDVAMAQLQGRGGDRAEIAGEGDLRVVVEPLLAKDHHRIAVDRILDDLPVGGAKRTCGIDAGNLGDEIRMRWRYGDAHGRLPRL